jgi:hypothetical protein
MVKTIAIGSLTLLDLMDKQQLQLVDEPEFFPEWRSPLPDLSPEEKALLDQVQSNYFDQTRRGGLSEGLVKLVILSPLLHLAGFYRAPFEVSLEQSVQVELQELGEVWQGRMDALVVQNHGGQNQFWIVVVESKSSAFGIDQAIPQALGYMFASPRPDLPTYGLVTNGSSYAFIKLTQRSTPEGGSVQSPQSVQAPQYSVSDIMLLLPGRRCLYTVLSILKRIGIPLQQPD